MICLILDISKDNYRNYFNSKQNWKSTVYFHIYILDIKNGELLESIWKYKEKKVIVISSIQVPNLNCVIWHLFGRRKLAFYFLLFTQMYLGKHKLGFHNKTPIVQLWAFLDEFG